jgi:predicted GIY-YIG superfamily endonuclease
LDYVYLIEGLSAERQRYLGMTDDLQQRLREHNAGESSDTAKF